MFCRCFSNPAISSMHPASDACTGTRCGGPRRGALRRRGGEPRGAEPRLRGPGAPGLWQLPELHAEPKERQGLQSRRQPKPQLSGRGGDGGKGGWKRPARSGGTEVLSRHSPSFACSIRIPALTSNAAGQPVLPSFRSRPARWKPCCLLRAQEPPLRAIPDRAGCSAAGVARQALKAICPMCRPACSQAHCSGALTILERQHTFQAIHNWLDSALMQPYFVFPIPTSIARF